MRLGCDGAQGYYISPPLPPDQLETWLAARPAEGRVDRAAAVDSDSQR